MLYSDCLNYVYAYCSYAMSVCVLSISVNSHFTISFFSFSFLSGLSLKVDLGCMDFMRARMGLGVFVTSAGKNKIMIHQAANEGYRGVYMVCFDGPDANKGFVSLLNGDNPAVFLQCEVCRLVLRRLGMSGIDYGKFSAENKFSMVGLKQETIVNLGLKELVLSAFIQPTSRL